MEKIASIIIPSLRPEGLKKTLESIYANTTGIDYEVIVVSPFDIEPHPNVVHIRESELGGNAKAVACGFEHAKGEYVIYMSDHCRVRPDWLKNMIAFMRPHDNEIFEGGFQHLLRDVGVVRNHYFGKEFATLPCIRKEKANMIGGFFNYPYYQDKFGDPDLSLRVYRAGGKVALCPDAAIEMLPNPQDKVELDNRRKYYDRDRASFFKRWGRIGKVLFVMEKYSAGNPEWGLTNVHEMLLQTLADSGLAHISQVFYYDEISRQVGLFAMGELLLELCGKEQPELIIFTSTGLLGIDPPRHTMNIITKTLGIKVCLMRFDPIGEEGHKFTNSWFPFTSYIVFIDSTLQHLGYVQHSKAVQGFTPFNSSYFYDKKLKRDIDVSFVGSIPAFPRRAEYIQFLREHAIDLITRGGQRFDPLSWEEYSDIIARSKISLNFCLNGCGLSELKGRVFDVTASGTLLIEDEGIETKDFLDEGKDFIMVNSKEEMLEKIKYYLSHDEEREGIAQSGYQKTTRLYNSKNFWGYTLSKMGFGIPDELARNTDYNKLCRKLEQCSQESKS